MTGVQHRPHSTSPKKEMKNELFLNFCSSHIYNQTGLYYCWENRSHCCQRRLFHSYSMYLFRKWTAIFFSQYIQYLLSFNSLLLLKFIVSFWSLHTVFVMLILDVSPSAEVVWSYFIDFYGKEHKAVFSIFEAHNLIRLSSSALSRGYFLSIACAQNGNHL